MKDFYNGDIYGVENEMNGWDAVLVRMEEIEQEIGSLNKKLKKKRGKKGKKGKKKKIIKRLKHLEREHEWLCMNFVMYQTKTQPQTATWWQNAITASLPKFCELVTAVVNRSSEDQSSTIYLPEKK